MSFLSQKSTRCFDSSQLSGEDRKPPEDKRNSENKKHEVETNSATKTVSKSEESEDTSCDCKKCGTKKRDVSISSQIKTTHNKSETGLNKKKCIHRKDKAVKNKVISNIGSPLTEHILMKTF